MSDRSIFLCNSVVYFGMNNIHPSSTGYAPVAPWEAPVAAIGRKLKHVDLCFGWEIFLILLFEMDRLMWADGEAAEADFKRPFRWAPKALLYIWHSIHMSTRETECSSLDKSVGLKGKLRATW
jgi:hypothetical protein